MTHTDPGEGPQRTERVQLRLTPEERAEIERRAAAEHRTVSEYLRWRALADMPVHPPREGEARLEKEPAP